MHIEKLIAAQNRYAARSNPNEVYHPIDPLTRLQADYAERFGKPEDKRCVGNCGE